MGLLLSQQSNEHVVRVKTRACVGRVPSLHTQDAIHKERKKFYKHVKAKKKRKPNSEMFAQHADVWLPVCNGLDPTQTLCVLFESVYKALGKNKSESQRRLMWHGAERLV